MAKSAFKQAKQSINKNAKNLETVREVGYKNLDSAISKLYKNLQTTQKGYGSAMTAGNRRNLELILGRTARMRAANRRMSHASTERANTQTDVGGILSGELQGMARDVDFNVDMANAAGRAGEKQVFRAGRLANSVMGIIQESAKEQQAHAQTIAGEALSRRTTADAATIAQQQHELAMAKMQQQFAMKQMEKQHELAVKQMKVQDKLADGALNTMGQGIAQAKQQVRTATEVAQEIYEAISIAKANGEEPDKTAILGSLVAKGLIDQEDADSGVVNYLFRAFLTDNQKGADKDNFAEEVLYALRLMPAWTSLTRKQVKKITDWVKSQKFALDTDPARVAAAIDGGGGGPKMQAHSPIGF